MDIRLSSPILDLHGVGPAKAKLLKNLGIEHVRDFLYTFPRRYDDFSRLTPIGSLKAGEQMTVRGKVKSIKSNYGFYGRRRVLRIFVELEDETGVLAITWYNLQFLPKQLWQGREMYVAGKVEDNTRGPRFRMRSPVLEFADKQELTHTGRITPVYPETHGVTSRFLRYQVKNVLPLINTIPEYLPADIRERSQLMSIHDAVKTVHFPTDADTLERAQDRLRFDELFFLQLAAIVRRKNRQHRTAPIIAPAKKVQASLQNQLPFALTGAQKQAIDEVVEDMAQSIPMNRLLQGDVGSGKSAVALVAAQLVHAAGKKVLYLAPTEVLARQQADAFKSSFAAGAVQLLIGALPRHKKEAIKEKMQQPAPLLVIGTHALLQEGVVAAEVGLVIVDEQHRFGVAQRKALQSLSADALMPHLLSMTATPIPRTLNLTVYGDLDVSVLNEMPPGRQPIHTTIVAPDKREPAIIHILEQLHAGRQAYVIAPLVEVSDRLEAKSAKETFAEMQQLFPDIAVGLLHGQMSSEEKEGALRNFAAGALQLLVATTVVEVGVNVPNATIIIIEGAERFGLAQLHQLRGRVGRGEHQSYCYLFPTTNEAVATPRLKILTQTTDGFVIAEEDLRLRGPGDIYGAAQSGFGDLKVASLLDYPMIKKTRAEAAAILKKDPDLNQYPILRKKVEQKNLMAHFE
jgi:ATP-dependent DNA helicase RecG